MPDKSQALHQVLVDKQLYTKDYESFKTQFSTPEKQQALYDVLFRKKLYTKSSSDFRQQFFNGQERPLNELLDAQQIDQPEQKTIDPTAPGLFANVKKGTSEDRPLSEQINDPVIPKREKMGRTMSALGITNQRFYGLPGELLKAVAIGGTAIDRNVFGKDVKAEDDPLYKAGQWYQDVIKEIAPNNPEYQGELQESVAQAVGDLAGLMVGSGAARMATKAPALLTYAQKTGTPIVEATKQLSRGLISPEGIIGATQIGVSEFEQAIDGGADEDEAFDVFIKNAAIGSVLERIPVQLFWKRLDDVTGGGVKNMLKKGFSGGMEEGITEVLQQAYANKKASEVYDASRSIIEGMGEAGGIGFGLGFLLNAMGVSLKGVKGVSKADKKAIKKTLDMVDGEIAILEKSIAENEKLQQDAIKEGEVTESDQQQYTETEEGGEIAETSDSDITEPGGEVQEEATTEAVEDAVTQEEIIDDLDKWANEFNQAKQKNDLDAIQELYDKVNIALNGPAQKAGEETARKFESLKKEIENYAEEVNKKKTEPVLSDSKTQQQPDDQTIIEPGESPVVPKETGPEASELSEADKLLKRGRDIQNRADKIKSKWHTKQGKFKANTPKAILDEARALQKEFTEISEKYDDIIKKGHRPGPFAQKVMDIGEKEKAFDGNPTQQNYDDLVQAETDFFHSGELGDPESPASQIKFINRLQQINERAKELNTVDPESYVEDQYQKIIDGTTGEIVEPKTQKSEKKATVKEKKSPDKKTPKQPSKKLPIAGETKVKYEYNGRIYRDTPVKVDPNGDLHFDHFGLPRKIKAGDYEVISKGDTKSPQGAPASPVIGTNHNPGKADVKAGERIQPSPLVRQDNKGRIIRPKSIQEIQTDLIKNIKKLTKKIGALKHMKSPIPGRRGIIGVFHPFHKIIGLKHANNLDTLSHEVGHALDDAYGLFKNIPEDVYGAIHDELKPFSKHGSKPPKGSPNAHEYEFKEGIAEWIRAYFINPSEAIENAPVFYNHYQKTLPKDAKDAMNEFSTDLRTYTGASAFDKVNASFEIIKQKTMLERLKETKGELLEALKPHTANPQDFKLTWGDKLNQKFVDSTNPYIMTVKFAAAVGNIDIDVVLPKNNPLVMARLFLGKNSKIENFLEKGFVHFNSDKRVIDAKTGEAVSLEWMLKEFNQTDRATFDKERQMMMAYAVAKRAQELPIKDVENQIRKALSRGEIIPSSVLYSNKRLYDKFFEKNEENRQALYDENEFYNKKLKESAQKTESKINQNYADKRARLEDIKREQQIEIDSQRQKYYDQKGHIPEKKRLSELRKFEQQAIEARETFDQEIDKLETERFKALQRLQGKIDEKMDAILKSSKMAKIKRSSMFYTGIGAGLIPESKVAQETIDEFNALPKETQDRITESLRRYRKFSDTILRYMVDSGRISEEAYKGIVDNNEEYIRLQRYIEADPGKEMEAFLAPGGKSIGNAKEVIHKIKGSSNIIKNPYETLLGFMHQAIIESDRNYVLKTYVDFMHEAKSMAGENAGKISEIISPGVEGDMNTIKVFRDGKKEYFKMDPDIYKSMKGIVGQLYTIPPILRFLPRLLRATVTNNPVFAGRNLLRDYQTMMVVSDNVSSIKDIIPKKLHKIGDLEPKDAFEVFGAGQGGYHLLNEDFYYKTLEEKSRELAGVDGNILVEAGVFAKHATEAFGKLSAASEKVTRMQEFKNSFRKSKAKGMDDYNAGLKAAYDARSLMDFAVVGEYMNVINQLIPFINAKIQGVRVAKRGFVKHPFLFTMKAGLTIMLPQVILRAMYSDEDDERYRQLPEYQRNMFWNIPTGTGWLMIPKPHDIAVMGTITDMVWDKAQGHTPNYKGFNTALFALLPFSRSDMAGPMRTFVELYANKDFFRDSNLVPAYEDKKALALRNYEYASRIGKFIGEPIGVDPRKVDHFIRGTTTYFGSQVMRLSDLGREDKKRNLAEITGFYKEEPVYNYSDVQWAQERAQEYGLETEKYYMYLRWMIRAYSDLESDDQKKEMAKSIRETSGFIREIWESYGIREEGAGENRDEFVKQTRKAASILDKNPLIKELKKQRELEKKATGRK